MSNMFLGAAAFGDGATWNIGSWQTGRVLDMDNMFEDAAHFNQDLHRWDTGLAEGMNCMFCGATLFGADAVWSIGNWNTNSVEDMNAMFENATSFNQDIGNWNTSKVGTGSTFRGPGDMADMFAGATSFNQNIDTKAVTSGLLPYTAWDTSEVTDMQSMFAGATSFGDGASWSIGHWDTGNVTDMSAMFESAAKFNQDISSWDTSSVEDMYYMFAGATTFDQDINFDSVTGAWDTSSVTWMESMFENARSFSGDISGWDTSNVADMSYMFEGAALFNSNISGWKTGNVTTMESMMTGAESFEQQLSYNSITGAWDTSQVISMAGMFGGASLFDGDISGWQTGNVRSTFAMFQDAEAFDQDLGGWEIGSLVEAEYMFSNSGLSPLSYSKLLRGWAAGSHQTGTPLQPILLDVTTTAGPGTTYYSTVEAARQSLVAENWLIVDGGSVAPRVPLVWSNPTATNLTLGQSLGSSTLTGGTASQVGSFSFADPSLQPGLGRSNENVTFTPDNDIEFTTVTFSLDVVVEPASAPPTPATQPAALSHTGITIDAQGLLGWVLLAAGLLALAGRRAYARARAR
jgi:surface protein